MFIWVILLEKQKHIWEKISMEVHWYPLHLFLFSDQSPNSQSHFILNHFAHNQKRPNYPPWFPSKTLFRIRPSSSLLPKPSPFASFSSPFPLLFSHSNPHLLLFLPILSGFPKLEFQFVEPNAMKKKKTTKGFLRNFTTYRQMEQCIRKRCNWLNAPCSLHSPVWSISSAILLPLRFVNVDNKWTFLCEIFEKRE